MVPPGGERRSGAANPAQASWVHERRAESTRGERRSGAANPAQASWVHERCGRAAGGPAALLRAGPGRDQIGGAGRRAAGERRSGAANPAQASWVHERRAGSAAGAERAAGGPAALLRAGPGRDQIGGAGRRAAGERRSGAANPAQASWVHERGAA
eukprot:tig00020592_g11676.t1